MARTLEEIVKDATARTNPNGGNGELLRSDLIEAIEGKSEPERSESFERVIDNSSFLTPQMKTKIKSDYQSYSHI
jgi:hypothetical protein